MMQKDELIIHPRNKKLIYQLKTGEWTPLKDSARGDQTRDFVRTEEERHLDGVDALGDWCRYLPVFVNPDTSDKIYPRNYHAPVVSKTSQFGDIKHMFGSSYGT
jgi:hypothetical protein